MDKIELSKVDTILDDHRGKKDSLITVLQKSQNELGYLSKDTQKYIADEMKIPYSKLYGVVTFYSQFHQKPRGKYIVRVCEGTACHVRGGDKVLETLKDELGVDRGETTKDLLFTLEPVACLGACGLAPVVMINDESYGRMTPESIVEVINEYRNKN